MKYPLETVLDRSARITKIKKANSKAKQEQEQREYNARKNRLLNSIEDKRIEGEYSL